MQLAEREDGRDVELRDGIEFGSEAEVTVVLRDGAGSRTPLGRRTCSGFGEFAGGRRLVGGGVYCNLTKD